jgi:hypothetical protein
MSEKGVSFLSDENRVSSGDLNSKFSPPDKAFGKSIEPLELADIAHFTDIPDFIEPTRSPYPILVQSPSSLQCIDGWEMIEQAKQQNETSIVCEIIHILHDSEIETAIWKASVRTKPLAGRCIYAEEVRNTCRLFAMLKSMGNPMIFSHGGARRGDGYIDRPENNIRVVLAERLGKSANTISKYLQHGKYLNDETQQRLIDDNVKKGFFEAIQKDKQSLIDELKSQQKDRDEIVDSVSARLLSLLEGFQASDSPEIVSGQTDQDESPASEIQSQQNDVPPPSAKPIKHNHWSGNPSTAIEKQLTEDEISQKFIEIGKLLIEIAENKEMPIQKRLQKFSDQIFRQFRLIQHLKHQLEKQSINPEEQC